MGCAFCGVPLARRGVTGPPPTYCSGTCKSKASYRRRRDEIQAKARAESAERRAGAVRDCLRCNTAFSPEESMRQVYCSRACGRAASRDTTLRTCTAPGCDRPHRAKGLCNMHYKAALRAEGRIKSEWNDRRRANYQKRRALKKGASAERIVPAEVFERDGWVCGICKAAVDRDRAYPDPLSPSLDHVVPLSTGGPHAMANVQLAHLGCNVKKGTKVA